MLQPFVKGAPIKLMTHFSSRARCAFGALLGATTLSALPLAAQADAPALKLLVRTTAFVPRVLAPGTSTSAPATVQAARVRLQGQLESLVPGSFVGRSFNYVGWSVIGVPANAKSTAFTRLRRAFGAGNVEGEVMRHARRTPNDPLFSQQYALPLVNAPTVWNRTTGSSNVIIAVLDTGANLSHPDLKDNLYKNPNGSIGYNVFSPSKAPEDDNAEGGDGIYHGTHCAGIIGARGNNGRQVSGVNWNVKIIPVKILDASGSGTNTSIMDGVNYVLSLKAKGVNIRATSNSYGGAGSSAAEKEAFGKLDAAGILSIYAANEGAKAMDNDTGPADYPTGYGFPSMVLVGASNSSDAPAYFSYYGAKTVQIFAPGEHVLSLTSGGGTRFLDGTSMACPLVAGGAALIWSVRPGLSALQMKALLISSAAQVAAFKGKCVSNGRLDLAAAFSLLGPLPTPTPAPTPTPTPTPSPSLILSGTVYASGKTTTLPGATVTLSNGLKTTSDAGGAYVIPGIKAGNYNLSGTLSGYSFPSTPLNFAGKIDTTLRQDLEASATAATTYKITGTVRNVQGRNINGIAVLLNGEKVPVATSHRNPVTGKDGYFEILSLGQGTYNLSASVDNQMATVIVGLPSKSADGNAIDVILQPKRSVTNPSAPAS